MEVPNIEYSEIHLVGAADERTDRQMDEWT